MGLSPFFFVAPELAIVPTVVPTARKAGVGVVESICYFFNSYLRTFYEGWRPIWHINGAAQGLDQLPRRRQTVTILRRSMRVGDLHQRGHAGHAAC